MIFALGNIEVGEGVLYYTNLMLVIFRVLEILLKYVSRNLLSLRQENIKLYKTTSVTISKSLYDRTRVNFLKGGRPRYIKCTQVM